MAEETGKDTERAGDEGRQREAPSQEQGEEYRGRMDQVGSIVGTGLDLIEAAVSLGIGLATRLGSVVQEQAAGRFEGAGAPGPEVQQAPYGEPGVGPPPFYPEGPGPAGGRGTPSEMSYIASRVPLAPGSAVRVSFTISNDSASTPRRVTLGVEGFGGEMQGATIDGRGFSVEPAEKLIEPLDFDKFTLVGAIPPDATSGTYSGWIVVSGEEELRIPVQLVVMGQPLS